MSFIFAILVTAGLTLAAAPARACLWDGDTLLQEQFQSPEIARVVLAPELRLPDAPRLRARIKRLESARRENDPAWWNDLAGAHIRLGELQRAVELLEPAVRRFPDDYGVHANLGTAYHLLGRYREAEREIARDLEINPQAHFGLERYHLALLQYLVRDRDYQSRHVYVDEWTLPHLLSVPPRLRKPEGVLETASTPLDRLDGYIPIDETSVAVLRARWQAASSPEDHFRPTVEARRRALEAVQDSLPPYRKRWDLGSDSHLEKGVLYLATLNPREPACYTMLGVICWRRGDLNLAIESFERAIRLGATEASHLRFLIRRMRGNMLSAQAPTIGFSVLLAILLGGMYWERRRRRKSA